jgi:broad specificity phosphatase PhoE
MPTPRNIYLARHGHREDFHQTELWRKTAARPHDPGLSEIGVTQANELAQRLKGCAIDHVFTSPFLRTVQTAFAVAQAVNCDIKVEDGICEWLNPVWFDQAPDFLPLEELNRRYPRIDLAYRSRGQRTWPEVNEKTDAWPKVDITMQLLLSEFTGNLLFVGHGSSVAGMAFSIAGRPIPLNLGMCSLVHFTSTPNGWETTLNGCTRHLSVKEEPLRFN